MPGARASVASVSARTKSLAGEIRAVHSRKPRHLRQPSRAPGAARTRPPRWQASRGAPHARARHQGPRGHHPLHQPGPAALLRRDPEPAARSAARAADQVWVGDITYLKVGAIYRYLAVVMDKYSRRVVGWSYGPRRDVRLTLQALNRAVRSRRPSAGVVFHTDRGIEYAPAAFKERIAELGFMQSMNRPGKVTDNAFIESFFHSMKTEIFHGCRFDEDQRDSLSA